MNSQRFRNASLYLAVLNIYKEKKENKTYHVLAFKRKRKTSYRNFEHIYTETQVHIFKVNLFYNLGQFQNTYMTFFLIFMC